TPYFADRIDQRVARHEDSGTKHDHRNYADDATHVSTLVAGNIDLDEAARCRSRHGGRNLGEPPSNQPPATPREDDDCDLSIGEVLLKANVAVCSYQDIETGCLSGVEQLAVLEPVPAVRPCLFNGVILKSRGDTSAACRCRKERAQAQETGASRLRAANSSTALTWSLVTGNCSSTSSMVIPSSRFSKPIATGVRVPLNPQAPLTLPGMLSTAGQRDQSSDAIRRSPSGSQLKAPRHGRHAAGARPSSEIRT